MSNIKPLPGTEIYIDTKKRRVYTTNLLPGKTHFMERLRRDQGKEFREWDPTRSKLAAAVMKGAPQVTIKKGDIILYLGISHGYTASFISDIIGDEGIIFGVDSAPRVVRDALLLSRERKNIIPILADASHLTTYLSRICAVDVLYQDVAQKKQVDIFLENCRICLKPGGMGFLAVKARSIDVKKPAKQLFEEARRRIEKEFKIGSSGQARG